MSEEEKKEEKKPEVKPEAKAVEAAPAAPAAATATAAPAVTKPQRPGTCCSCNKNLKRKTWFYRNSKWYCTKRCFNTAKEKAAGEAAKATATAAAAAAQPAPSTPPTA